MNYFENAAYYNTPQSLSIKKGKNTVQTYLKKKHNMQTN